MSFAQLLKQVFDIRRKTLPQLGGALKIIAAIEALNGVTIICDEVHESGTAARRRLLINNPQTINGQQTSYMLSFFGHTEAELLVETMVANPRINEIPVMIGGDGREEVHEFYAKHFLPQIPPDAHDSNGLDATWDRAHREAGRDGIGSDRAVQWRQNGARAFLLGSGIGAGAAWTNRAGPSAGGGSGRRAISA